MELELGPVEGALAREHFIVETGLLERGLEVGFGAIPLLIAADPLVGPGGELHLIVGKAEVAVDEVGQQAEAPGLADQLVTRAEDMPIVLGELANAHDAMEGAVRLVAMATAVFSEPHRQFAIAGNALLEDLDVRRAVH